MIGLRSTTTWEYEKLFTAFGTVKEDSIFSTFRELILSLVRDGDFASLLRSCKGFVFLRYADHKSAIYAGEAPDTVNPT